MISTEQQLIAEAYTKMIEEAMHCSHAKKGCKCNKCKDCKSNQKKNVKEALDPVGKEDKDVNNDGKTDSTDKYLQKRREAIAKAKGEDENEEESSKKNESLNLAQPESLSFRDLYNKVIAKK